MSLNLPLASFSAVMLFLLFDAPAQAQLQNLRVQLPVVRQYQNTSQYLIPDGGTFSAGGISRSASGTTSRGAPGLRRPFANRFGGVQASQAQSSVKASILLNREISEDILAGASPARPAQLPYYKEVWARQQSARLNQKKTIQPRHAGSHLNTRRFVD